MLRSSKNDLVLSYQLRSALNKTLIDLLAVFNHKHYLHSIPLNAKIRMRRVVYQFRMHDLLCCSGNIATHFWNDLVCAVEYVRSVLLCHVNLFL